MNKRQLFIVALLISICVLILLHQYITWGILIEMKDVLHHEFFAFSALILALGIIFGGLMEKRG